MGRKGIGVVVSELEREQLLSMSRSRSLPHSLVRRAKIVLMAADGHTTNETAMLCEVTPPAITHWKKRFVAQGLAGLHDEACPRRPRTHDDEARGGIACEGAAREAKRGYALECAFCCCANGYIEEFGGAVSIAVRCATSSLEEL